MTRSLRTQIVTLKISAADSDDDPAKWMFDELLDTQVEVLDAQPVEWVYKRGYGDDDFDNREQS